MDALDDRRRTRLTRALVMGHASLNPSHAYSTRMLSQDQGQLRRKQGRRGQIGQNARTWFGREEYSEKRLGKMNTWVKGRKAQGKAPSLHTADDLNEALTELLKFVTSRCFVHNNQQSTVRGYIAAIHYFTR